MKTIVIENLEQMERFAADVASHLNAGSILALSGDLGAGKTTFTKYLAKALGIKRTVNSPTFTIMKSYKYPAMGDREAGILQHIDAYRLEGSEEELGLDEGFENGISVIEWPQYLPDLERQDALYMEITRPESGSEQERKIVLEASGPLSRKLEELL